MTKYNKAGIAGIVPLAVMLLATFVHLSDVQQNLINAIASALLVFFVPNGQVLLQGAADQAAKLGALLLAAVLLTACTGQTPAATVFQLRSGFDAALVPVNTYAALPLCPAAQPCSEAKVVVELNKAAQAAKATLDVAETTVREHPTLDASAAIAAARSSVDAAVKIFNLYGVK